MIYTLTLNPAIDYRLNTGRISYGETNRALSEELSFGGKGINVSKVLKNLGIESKALGFCAGFTGKALISHLDEYGIENDFVELCGGNTRINLKLCDGQNCETEINACGPKVTECEKNILFDKIKNSVTDGDTLILSGSVPIGMDGETYADVIELVKEKNIRIVVDAQGELLLNTLRHKPFLVKPNLSELCGIVGKDLSTPDEIADGAKRLRALGAKNVLVSLGADGALLADEKGNVTSVAACKGRVANTVGAGDSMVAGFVAGAHKGYEYALRLANACGGATAFSVGLATKEAVEKLMNNRSV
ncbi:MAG: 1-phosphofructokinase [Ruminococcaceae bacterium]|nr:1-phosphofructokinase [Oscillospiraceae bacterium]